MNENTRYTPGWAECILDAQRLNKRDARKKDYTIQNLALVAARQTLNGIVKITSSTPTRKRLYRHLLSRHPLQERVFIHLRMKKPINMHAITKMFRTIWMRFNAAAYPALYEKA